jgi:putative ABC transport system permease protein
MRLFPRWFRRNRLDRDLARELDTHLDLHVHHLIAGGVSQSEAWRRARLELGGVDQVTEQVRDARAGAWLDSAMHDARDAFRGLERTPVVTLTAVALIALVIGGNTTIYSMVHAIITKPAPGVRGDRLVTLELRIDGQPAGPAHSFPDYVDYVAQSTTVAPLLASLFHRFTVAVDHVSYAVNGLQISSNYFDTLGVKLARGRPFTEAENSLDASGLVTVVSDRFWQDELQGAENVIGRSVVVNGHSATIVGVAPPGFQGAWLAGRTEVWVPLIAFSRMDRSGPGLLNRGLGPGPILINGRLAPGASLSQARAEFAIISARLQSAYPVTNRRKSVGVVPYSMTAGGDSLISTRAPQFLAVFSLVTALTLMIVCANVANLMLGRAVVRQREMALRQMLGASRGRILRTLITEGLIISIAAWLAACMFALVVSKAVPRLFPPSAQGVALLLDLTPDWQVVAYAMLLAVLGTVAFTVAPAGHAWKQELLPSLKSGELGVVAGRSRVSSVLVIAQLAFAVLLMTSAGLAYRSLSLLGTIDFGFNKDNLVVVTLNTVGSGATKDTNLALLDRLRDRFRGVREVGSVAYTGPYWNREAVQANGSQPPIPASTISIGAGYFGALGITLLAGHEFAEHESGRTTNAAIISQSLAESLWPQQSALGRTLRLGPRRAPVEVIGVTPNALFDRRRRETRPDFVFLSLQQDLPPPGEAVFYVRYAGDLPAVAPAIRRAVLDVDTRVPITYLRTMDTDVNEVTAPVRIITIWLTLFAVGSLMIAAIGQYAAIAFDMRRRTRDFGVRIALGASSRQILGSVIGEGLRWTAAGLTIGFALSIVAGRAGRSLLFGITPTDAPTYLGVFSLLAAASLFACYLPARRAARIDPIHALRHE